MGVTIKINIWSKIFVNFFPQKENKTKNETRLKIRKTIQLSFHKYNLIIPNKMVSLIFTYVSCSPHFPLCSICHQLQNNTCHLNHFWYVSPPTKVVNPQQISSTISNQYITRFARLFLPITTTRLLQSQFIIVNHMIFI